MKLHRSTINAVIHGLTEIFVENRHADKVIEFLLKSNPTWGARDRRFIAETIYSIVRYQRLYAEAFKTAAPPALLTAYLIDKEFEIPPFQELLNADSRQIRRKLAELRTVRVFAESIPDWIDETATAQLGSRWQDELSALNTEAPVVLRVNTLKVSRGALQQQLRSEGIDTQTDASLPDAILLEKRGNVFRSQAFKDGLFEVQDGGSQRIAPYLNVEPGMRVVDACAGAGGKTLHLAALMHNKGKIIAMDVETFKLQELTRRARRAGVSNLETRPIEGSKTIKRLEKSADRVLLDVPCSGLGVLKRNPDAKWKLTPERLAELQQTQQQILSSYSQMVKPGGDLVYATCSILPAENEAQVTQFLANSPEFTLVNQHHCWPSEGYDGFYMALIHRNS